MKSTMNIFYTVCYALCMSVVHPLGEAEHQFESSLTHDDKKNESQPALVQALYSECTYLKSECMSKCRSFRLFVVCMLYVVHTIQD